MRLDGGRTGLKGTPRWLNPVASLLPNRNTPRQSLLLHREALDWPRNLDETLSHHNSWEVAMVERIVSGLFDNPYETILGIFAACCFVSLLLAATI